VTIMILPAIQPAVPEFKSESISRQNLHDSTFADHFDRQLMQEKIQGKDKFGVQSKEEKSKAVNYKKFDTVNFIEDELNSVISDEALSPKAIPQDQNVNKQSEAVNYKKFDTGNFIEDALNSVISDEALSPRAIPQDQNVNKESDQTIVGILSQFMQDLQKTAERKDVGPGEWVAVLPDHSMLQKVADEAGMGEADMSFLLQQLEAQRGELNLSDFLNILEQHFQTIIDVPAITVPETELPFLETLLTQMGFSSEDITALSNKAVKNEGKLDLSLFLEGLHNLTANNNSQDTPQIPVLQLSDWESEQLQNLLTQAGVRQGKLTELFPERYFEKNSGGEQKEFFLSFERLQDVLSKAITDINQNRPQPNLPGFLKELDNVFSHTQFNDASVGWAPVVQHSLTAVFRELQNTVELARKKFIEEMGLENKSVEEELQTVEQSILEGKTGTLAEYFSHTSSDTHLNEFTQPPTLTDVVNFNPFQVATDSLPDSQLLNSSQSSHVVTRSPQQLQAQVFQQISAAVMHGVGSDEHHLVLRLYPQELGEVKVDMLVKNDQISITFNMENGRVKEMLESNMEQFRENMEQKGFSLGECNVSVGERENSDNEWRRFMMSGNSEMQGQETLEDLPDDVLSLRGNIFQQDGRAGALNLFV